MSASPHSLSAAIRAVFVAMPMRRLSPQVGSPAAPKSASILRMDVARRLLDSPWARHSEGGSRPGGNPLRTALGTGGLFNESSGVSIVLIDGRVATTVIAPSEELALSIVSSLSGLTQ
jgi:hypothetical protein